MDEISQDQLAAEANALLSSMLELAKGTRASAFSIAAVAVIRAYVETSPGLAPWAGNLLAHEGMAMLSACQQQEASSATPMPMPTASIH